MKNYEKTNQEESQYEIRLCKKSEYEKLIDFIKHYVDESHIFVFSKEIFEFQFGKGESGTYDVAVAVHKQNDEIHALMGFIRSSLYDKTSIDHPQVIYGVTWARRSDVSNQEIAGLGRRVMFHVLDLFPHSTYVTLGLSKHSQKIYQELSFCFGVLNHYYIANEKRENYSIAWEPERICRPKSPCGDLIKMIDFEEIPEISNICYPRKDRTYIQTRYANHPAYRYNYYGIYCNGRLRCVWITRVEQVKKSSCIRVVDMIGDMNETLDIYDGVQNILQEGDFEYIDVLNHGLDDNIFRNMGFTKVSGETVIPNYFHPFVRKNIDLHFAYKSKRPVVIFRADGDQDRPRELSEWQTSSEQ